jgi:hypothetical protein
VDWWTYVKEVAGEAGDDSTHKISKRMGGKPTASAVGRWDGTEPKPESVIKFARTYRRRPTEALAVAGILTPEEVGEALSDVSNGAFAVELIRRLERLEELERLFDGKTAQNEED